MTYGSLTFILKPGFRFEYCIFIETLTRHAACWFCVPTVGFYHRSINTSLKSAHTFVGSSRPVKCQVQYSVCIMSFLQSTKSSFYLSPFQHYAWKVSFLWSKHNQQSVYTVLSISFTVLRLWPKHNQQSAYKVFAFTVLHTLLSHFFILSFSLSFFLFSRTLCTHFSSGSYS